MLHLGFFIVFLVLTTVPSSLGQTDLEQALNDALNTEAPPVFRNGTPAGGSQGRPQFPPIVVPPQTVPLATSPSDKLDLFTGQTEDPAASFVASTSARVTEKAARNAAGLRGQRVRSFSRDLSELTKGICMLPLRAECDYTYKYRIPDGSCNNPNPNILRGASITAQARFLDPEYGDDDNLGDVPRINGKNGPLSSPRKISNEIFSTTPAFRSPFSTKNTITLTHFAQFVDHDIIKTPALKKPNLVTSDPYDEVSIKDCHRDCDDDRPECFPIQIPDNDNNFANKYRTRCLPLVRSKPAPINNCEVGPRQQMNERTSFLDLSSTYGSSIGRLNDLRQKVGGRLNASQDNLLPFGPKVDDCLSDIQQCFNSGDDRHQEVPMLTVIHIVFLREHNRIAGLLSQINPSWLDEKLFQETRKILTGIYQHIVFNEFLPVIVGQSTVFGAGLLSKLSGHSLSYSPWIDPSTVNEFGAAAYRFGHSLVGRFVRSFDHNFQQKGSNELRLDLFNNRVIRNVEVPKDFGPTRIGRWMSSTFMRKNDRFISDQLRNHLFESNTTGSGKSDGFDLASFNIQRGRDHGVPGYNKFREYCGLYPAAMFNTGHMGFRDHDDDTVSKLSKVYSHPDDIDLFAGGMSERPFKEGEILGPTFKCLITLQFINYKLGDRFFYENPDPNTGFTVAQLNDIKKQTFAGIYCRSLELDTIQRKVFISPSNQNPRIPCKDIPEPTLDLWSE